MSEYYSPNTRATERQVLLKWQVLLKCAHHNRKKFGRSSFQLKLLNSGNHQTLMGSLGVITLVTSVTLVASATLVR